MCNNTNGSYNCTCKEGFTGDGLECSGQSLIVTCFVVLVNLDIVALNIWPYTTTAIAAAAAAVDDDDDVDDY